MHAIVITKQGTPVHPNVSFVDDWPAPPTPTGGEVTIRTEATALNHLDLWVGRGVPGQSYEYPRISGSDICGIVEAVGPEVNEAWLGQRVILNGAIPVPTRVQPGVTPAPDALAIVGEHSSGVHAAKFNAPVSQILAVGEDFDPQIGAAFGLAFLTAWGCLVTKSQLTQGQTVLITGIGGGVALAGLAIAKHYGCRVVVTSRHESKLQRATELGADAVVLDEGADWSRAVRGCTDRRGVDIALDSIGKVTHLWALKSLARGGTYVTPGCTTGPDATTDLARIFWNQLRIIGSTMGNMADFRAVTALLQAGHLTPVIDSVHQAANGADAFGRLESGEQFGKVVIDWHGV